MQDSKKLNLLANNFPPYPGYKTFVNCIMKDEKFEINFTYKYKKYRGLCHKFKIHKKPQIFVSVDTGDKYEKTFTLYEMDKENKIFFWFPQSEIHDAMLRKIESAIKKIY